MSRPFRFHDEGHGAPVPLGGIAIIIPEKSDKMHKIDNITCHFALVLHLRIIETMVFLMGKKSVLVFV
jgi:hypothetical protein